MKKYMSNEEFCNCHTIDHRDLYKIDDELERKNIRDMESKIKYVRENYGGQIYMNFVLRELDDIISMNYHQVNDEYTFSKCAVDGLLRSYLFATQYMQEGLPEHAYDYIKGKANSFINELLEQYKQNENLKDI